MEQKKPIKLTPQKEVITKSNPEDWKNEINKFLAREDIVIMLESQKDFITEKEFIFTCIYYDRKEYTELIIAQEQYKIQQQKQEVQLESDKKLIKPKVIKK